MTSYVVTVRPGGRTVVVRAGVREVTVRKLHNGSRYRLSVAAVNAVGRGTATTGVAVVPAGRPGKASKVTAVARTHAAVVHWRAADARGAHVLRYKVISGAGKSTIVNGRKHRAVVHGLRSGHTYTFRVLAINRVGPGRLSAPSNAVRVR